HHSSPVLDWLAPNRRHPVDLIGSRLAVGLPLLALGFTVPTIAAHYAIKRAQGLFVHANIKVSLGSLRWFIASPEFHHWHHDDHPLRRISVTAAIDPPARDEAPRRKSPTSDRSFRPLLMAGAASVSAGAVHAAAVGAHAEHPAAARTFAIVAFLQVAWGVAAF